MVIILGTHGKESNLLFLQKLQPLVYQLYFSLHNGDTITNPYDIANTFNNWVVSIAGTTTEALTIHRNIFQTILGKKIVVQYFCSLMIK